jgi:plastocyanin
MIQIPVSLLRLFASLSCVLAGAFCAVPVSAAVVSGRITAGEGVEAPERVEVAIDAWVCAKDGKTVDPSLQIGAERGLANVIVTLLVPDAPPPTAEGEHLIDQQGCVFEPHVSIVTPGQTVKVRNSDKVLHTFRTITQHNRSVNKAQVAGKEDTFVFAEPEIIRAACDVHWWMSAVIAVAPNAFTVASAADGRFSIPAVPPGAYTVLLWHEKLGERTESVTVSEAGGELTVLWPPSP